MKYCCFRLSEKNPICGGFYLIKARDGFINCGKERTKRKKRVITPIS
jgi:hypothetical protein